MKSRVVWFLFLYIILGLFLCYDLTYLGVIWSNRILLDLFNSGFEIIGPGRQLFTYATGFAVYGLPTIGTLFSIFAVVSAILSQSFILKISTPKSKLIALSVSFIVLLIGFYFDFLGQLFYEEWNDDSIFIVQSGKVPIVANFYYYHWIPSLNAWIIFGVFFGLAIICFFIITKLYYLNIQWFAIDRKEKNEEFHLEIISPFVNNLEFDPNETQTITLNLETNKFSTWKISKKKDKIKKKKKSNKK